MPGSFPDGHRDVHDHHRDRPPEESSALPREAAPQEAVRYEVPRGAPRGGDRHGDFRTRLAAAVTGSSDTPLVLLGNFEVERQWARGEHTLPRLSALSANAVVNRMDEFTLLLAGEHDHVVLKTQPDGAYLAYLSGLGMLLPTVHTVGGQDPQRTVTEDALADPVLLRTLAGLAAAGAHLVPHGVSEPEERLAATTGMPVAGPGAALCKSVNSKVYSRRVADELGLRQPRGWTCETVAELGAALAAAVSVPTAPFVVKEAFGVSGKGIATLDGPRRADRVHRMVARQAERSGRDAVAFVVEEWVAKRADLNYQFTVGRDGSTRFDFVKELLTEGGVHRGHRMPAGLSAAQFHEVVTTAELLGKRLAADGYFGVVGVDAMVDEAGGLYPVVEINARHNMSTYQARLQEQFVCDDRIALARHYPVHLDAPLPFDRLQVLLEGLLLDGCGGNGLLVNNFATVNAGFPPDTGPRTDRTTPGGPVDGRLYGILVADSDDELTALDAEITACLPSRRGHGS
ncbi:ATP-grasp domain-containing protein [Streptomyces sp. NPDC020965]|uniref:preATP grasp domain-containing protein n=1 Tax=Streptomyces sp. NPDC020965 TaxID=3365105 RepID=UPI0037B3707D